MRKTSDLSVVVGAHNLYSRESSQKRLQVKKIVLHPSYKKQRPNYDIALLQLSSAMPFNDNVSPICVDNSRFPDHTECVTSGVFCRKSPSVSNEMRQLFFVTLQQTLWAFRSS